MKIEKVLNNNVIMAKNETNQEVVVMGKGLAFHRKAGDTIDPTKIEKAFILQKYGVSDKLAKLLKDTSELYLNISSNIIDYAKLHLTHKLDDYLYVALTDHISFAVSRYKQGILLKNPLLWEIKRYYKPEFQVALKALDMIEKETGFRFDDDEAASIALHLVNSQLSQANMSAVFQMTEIVNDILKIVEDHFQMELDESSVNYERFLMHLRFVASEFVRKEKVTNTLDELFYEQIQQKFPEAFQCMQKVVSYLKEKADQEISIDDKVYLSVHIHRVTNRHQNSE
ncbi:BglG family transcription antiterminator LicT [Bacillus sp. REN16]|uniref:BglG family transcription antiterminator LicT n=1 Tax=Bacillus sp. REN16 TaxID=2887296 RepID=UPI001E3EFBD4|nr:PRD domain-containing protein [Bacillus sp. REN16]MCC3356400.1 PRD domain-containing protein [Bacillus sp. REN16]